MMNSTKLETDFEVLYKIDDVIWYFDDRDLSDVPWYVDITWDEDEVEWDTPVQGSDEVVVWGIVSSEEVQPEDVDWDDEILSERVDWDDGLSLGHTLEPLEFDIDQD